MLLYYKPNWICIWGTIHKVQSTANCTMELGAEFTKYKLRSNRTSYETEMRHGRDHGDSTRRSHPISIGRKQPTRVRYLPNVYQMGKWENTHAGPATPPIL